MAAASGAVSACSTSMTRTTIPTQPIANSSLRCAQPVIRISISEKMT
jgi:hypothetical protein